MKETAYFAEGFHIHVAGLGCSDSTAGRRIQHPNRQLQEPTGINAFATAVCHRHAASNQRGMHTYSEAVPRMPWVQDLPEFNNMGVVLIACITRTAPISALAKKRLPDARPKRIRRPIAESFRSRDWAAYIIDTASLRSSCYFAQQTLPQSTSGDVRAVGIASSVNAAGPWSPHTERRSLPQLDTWVPLLEDSLQKGEPLYPPDFNLTRDRRVLLHRVRSNVTARSIACGS